MDKEFFNEIDELNKKLAQVNLEEADLSDKLEAHFLEFNEDIFEGINTSDLTKFIDAYYWRFSAEFKCDICEYLKKVSIKEYGAAKNYPFLNEFKNLTDYQKFDLDNYFYNFDYVYLRLDIMLSQLSEINSLNDISPLMFMNIIKEFYRREIIDISYMFRCEFGDDMNYVILSRSELLEMLGEFDNYEMKNYIKSELCPDCDCAYGCIEEENLEDEFEKAVKRIMIDPWDADYITIKKVK